MAEQAHLITDDNWQKRKCTKCGELLYATGYGGETRQWRSGWCPDCSNEYYREMQFRRRDDRVERYPGAYGV